MWVHREGSESGFPSQSDDLPRRSGLLRDAKLLSGSFALARVAGTRLGRDADAVGLQGAVNGLECPLRIDGVMERVVEHRAVELRIERRVLIVASDEDGI